MLKPKAKSRLVLAALLGAASLVAPPGVAQAEPKTALRVAYIPVITWLPALVAKEEGIFEKNGLDVTFTKFPNLINLPGTLGKQFDLAPSTAPDLLNAVANGLNIAAVSGETLETSANKSFQVIVKPDSGINTHEGSCRQTRRRAGCRLGNACGDAISSGQRGRRPVDSDRS